MIVIEAKTVEELKGRMCPFGVLVHDGLGTYFSDFHFERRRKASELREGRGWVLRDIEPEVYAFVKKHYPEELI